MSLFRSQSVDAGKAIRRKYRVKLEIGYPVRKDSRSTESEQGISAKRQEEEEQGTTNMLQLGTKINPYFTHPPKEGAIFFC